MIGIYNLFIDCQDGPKAWAEVYDGVGSAISHTSFIFLPNAFQFFFPALQAIN